MKIGYCDPVAFNALLFLRREHRIGWRAFGLGMVIASFADKGTSEAWPSRATLSAFTGIEETDISRVVRELANAGFLAIEFREGHSNIYRLTHGDLATGGKLPPSGKQPPTHGCLASKPVGVQPPITIKEQPSNNNLPRDDEKPSSPITETPPLEMKPPDAKVGVKAISPKNGKPKGRSGLMPHPVLLEWNEERTAAGMDPSVVGPQNNAFAAKLQEAVPEVDFRRKVLKAFFARKTDGYLVDEGFVFFQLVNHRLDQCIAAARKSHSGIPSRSTLSESTGEAKRMLQFFKKAD